MFQIIPYKTPEGKVLLLTPGPADMQCIMWFGSWVDFKTFTASMVEFVEIQESHSNRNIPAMVLEAFGEKER